MPSEPQEKIPYLNSNSAMDGGTSLEAIDLPLSNFDLELPLESVDMGSSWSQEVSQSASMQWQYDNILLGHCTSFNNSLLHHALRVSRGDTLPEQ